MTKASKRPTNKPAGASAPEPTNADTPPSDLRAALRATRLFDSLDDTLMANLEKEVTHQSLVAGETLIRQGDPGDGMYVIISGRLRVALKREPEPEQVLGDLEAGESVGAMTLLTGQRRTATAYALEATEVAGIAKSIFERLAHTSPATATALREAVGALIRRRQLHSALSATKLLNTMDVALLQDLEAELSWISLVSGQTLIQQGEPGDCMYVVISGRLRVVREQPGQEQRMLREVGRGESIGEIALLAGQRRTATVYAVRDTEVAKLSKESFERLLVKYPVPMLRTFIVGIVDIVLANETGRARPRAHLSLSVALIPAHPDVVLTEFAQRLVKAFAKLGPTLHLNSQVIDQVLGKQGIAQNDIDAWNELDIQLVGFLSEQETEYAYVIYEADATPTPWTRRCLRQADQVLIVGHSNSDPTPGAVEAELVSLAAAHSWKQTSLVLLHRDGRRPPSGTLHWLALRQVEQHHHVRWDTPGDFERVARIVGGRAVGLVLGGGGARGAAHIGVIRAMQEAGIPIDIVGGTSAGSIMSGLYALDGQTNTMINRFRNLLGTDPGERARDMTLPVVALSSGHTVVQGLKRLFGETQIEDLWLPFFCVSTNLTRAEPVVHRSGLLRHGARASSTIPGFNPPVVQQGELLVDGALLNNLPMNAMRQLCGSGTVIAVDVTPPVDMAEIEPYGDILSGWQAAWERINPLQEKHSVPSMAALLFRSVEVGIVHELKSQIGSRIADLYIRPPVEEFGLVQTEAMEKIAEIGYQCAKEQLAQWQKQGGYPTA